MRGSSRSRARRRRQRGALSWDPGGRRGGRWRERAERREEGARRAGATGGAMQREARPAGEKGPPGLPVPAAPPGPQPLPSVSGLPRNGKPPTPPAGTPLPRARPHSVRAPTRAPSSRTPGTRGGRRSAPSIKCERLEPRAQSNSRLPRPRPLRLRARCAPGATAARLPGLHCCASSQRPQPRAFAPCPATRGCCSPTDARGVREGPWLTPRRPRTWPSAEGP